MKFSRTEEPNSVRQCLRYRLSHVTNKLLRWPRLAESVHESGWCPSVRPLVCLSPVFSQTVMRSHEFDTQGRIKTNLDLMLQQWRRVD